MDDKHAEGEIESLIDDEFLNKLTEVGRIYGWSGDYCEIGNFIIDLHEIKGVEISPEDIEPYETNV